MSTEHFTETSSNTLRKSLLNIIQAARIYMDRSKSRSPLGEKRRAIKRRNESKAEIETKRRLISHRSGRRSRSK